MRPLLVLVAVSPLCALAQSHGPPAPSSTAVFARAEDASAEPLAGLFELQLRRALTHSGLEVFDPATKLPQPPPDSLAEGERLMQEGRDAFNNLDPDTALAKFRAAADFFARHPVAASSEQMAAAFVALGATSQLNGNKFGAQEAFRRALVLAPTVQVDPLFGPEAKDALERARTAMASLPRSPLRVDSLPSGAEVRIDGRDADLTPAPERTVPVGRHHVVLRRAGYRPFGAFPDVVAEKPATLRPTLEPLPELTPLLARADEALTGSHPEAAARALSGLTGARFLVLARVEARDGKIRAVVQAWDVETGNKLEGLTVDLDRHDWKSTDRLAGELREWIAHPPAAGGPLLSFEAPPLLRKWWFWAAVGGAAAATAGVVALSQGGGHHPDLVLGTP